MLVGYDVRVIVRPDAPRADVAATRTAAGISFRNTGNTNVELYDGRQCDPQGKACTELPPKRLYAGAVWDHKLTSAGPIEYSLKPEGQRPSRCRLNTKCESS